MTDHDPSDLLSGRIHREFSVICGWCGWEMYFSGARPRREAIKRWMEDWMFTRQRGWICPDCAEKWRKGHRP